jgi:hypothetical protein
LTGGGKEPDLTVSGITGGRDGGAGGESGWKSFGNPGLLRYAVKAGPWIFLNGHEAFDFESGIPEEVAEPAGFPLFGRPRSRREGDFILHRMRRILREFGSDLSHGVRLDQYYPNPRAVAALARTRRSGFRDWCRAHSELAVGCCAEPMCQTLGGESGSWFGIPPNETKALATALVISPPIGMIAPSPAPLNAERVAR